LLRPVIVALVLLAGAVLVTGEPLALSGVAVI
jgi:hypothetical protein